MAKNPSNPTRQTVSRLETHAGFFRGALEYNEKHLPAIDHHGNNKNSHCGVKEERLLSIGNTENEQYIDINETTVRSIILMPSSKEKNWNVSQTLFPDVVKKIFIRDADLRLLQPSEGPEQWKQFLAAEHHWRRGYSARSLAYCWENAKDGFPKDVQQTLSTSPLLSSMEMLLAVPEHKVPLPGGKKASQNDVWVLGLRSSELVSMTVEGKVSESFGPTMNEWLGVNPSPGKLERLDFLCSTLGLSQPLPGEIRYQLLHRTASAVIEARRFNAPHSVMLVHSFSNGHERFEDFEKFVNLFGLRCQP
ncbi:MAG: hypothetical protein HQL86_07680, partial [Magnetococcales bacterium]|nr:hypothetical protein [Magnetococcales bacterium]